ncbi:MAG: prolipoprotein diacylglyceryl transferase [Flavobacteriaceae bacterium]|nr:prolipoprotein diacylglyceryl transferase [Flavobacteriaceae bacterium]
MLLNINWNPSPELFRIFGFPIRYYGLMFVVAFLLGIYILKKLYKNENVKEEHVDTIFIWVVIATIFGARFGEVFFYSWDSFKHRSFLEIILPIQLDPFKVTGFQGLASHGAVIGVILSIYFYTRKYKYKPFIWILDRIVIPVAIGGVFVRIGNLMNSEIVGKITDSSLGFRFIRHQISGQTAMRETEAKTLNEAYKLIENNPKFNYLLDQVPYRYPSQIFESIGYILVFLTLWYVYWKTNKKEKPGYIFGLFMVLLWSVRFLIEFLKASQGGIESSFNNNLTTGQLLSIPLILVGFYFMFRKVKRY